MSRSSGGQQQQESLRVLHPRSEAAMRAIRNAADTLRSVALPRPSMSSAVFAASAPDSGSMGASAASAVAGMASEPISRDDVRRGTRLYLAADDVAQDNIRVVGEELRSLVDELDASLEAHFAGFFAHLKRQHEQELALWVRSSTAVKEENVAAHLPRGLPASQNASSPTTAAAAGGAGALTHVNSTASLLSRPSEHALHTASQLAEEVQRDVAFLSLQSWLLIELESLVSVLNVSKAAVYLHNPLNPDFLRLAAVVPRAIAAATGDPQAAPAEVSSASHSVLTTVAASGVGASIVRDAVAHPMTPRGEISFRKCICMPLFAGRATDEQATVGSIIVADKLNGRDFELADELRVWAFCSSASGVFQRYPTEWFVPPPIATGGDTRASRAYAASKHGSPISQQQQQLPLSTKRNMVCNVEQLHARIWLGLDSAASLPGIKHDGAPAGVSSARSVTNSKRGGNAASTFSVTNMPRHLLPAATSGAAAGTGSKTKVSLAPMSPLSAAAAAAAAAPSLLSSEGSSQQQKAPSGHNKMAVIRTGTIADAARAKMRITGDSSSGNSNSRMVAASTFTKLDKPVDDRDLLDGRSHEEVIENVAPYLRNLEGLWRKALDECARMKNEVSVWRHQVEVRDAKIVELEVALRHLTRSVGAMQSDVDLLRRAVPDSLSLLAKDTAGA